MRRTGLAMIESQKGKMGKQSSIGAPQA